MIVAGTILATLVMRRTRTIGIAQHHRDAAVDRRQHEAAGNERAQAEHREHPGRNLARCTLA